MLGTPKLETRLVTLTLVRGVLLVIIMHLNVIINLSVRKKKQFNADFGLLKYIIWLFTDLKLFKNHKTILSVFKGKVFIQIYWLYYVSKPKTATV